MGENWRVTKFQTGLHLKLVCRVLYLSVIVACELIAIEE